MLKNGDLNKLKKEELISIIENLSNNEMDRAMEELLNEQIDPNKTFTKHKTNKDKLEALRKFYQLFNDDTEKEKLVEGLMNINNKLYGSPQYDKYTLSRFDRKDIYKQLKNSFILCYYKYDGKL